MTRPVTSIKRPRELVDAGLIPKSQQAEIEQVAKRYAIAIPQTIAARIDPNDPRDPLALQFVPTKDELNRLPEERDDPIGDDLKSPTPGIVHRYRDRALLKLVSVCPVYCRFCFRRESVGPKTDDTGEPLPSGILEGDDLTNALQYLRDNDSIWEVIITGGDPLVLSPRRIKALTDALARITHIKIVRWHTRVPIVMPQHIANELCKALTCDGKAVYIALHTNHVRELNSESLNACARLIDAGHAMVSQTVLLSGINDNAPTLIDLMRKLVENRIKPYYLHHPDLAPGTGHFRVSIDRGRSIVQEMRQNLSGLALPTYVLDIPGAYGKVPIGPNHITRDQDHTQDGAYIVTDPNGNDHTYLDTCAAPPVRE